MFSRLAPLALLAFASSLAHGGALIVGGGTVSETDPDAASTVAIVTTFPEGQGICTGSLLATDLIVTAAHCVVGSNGKTVPAKALTLIFAKDVRSPKRTLVVASGVKSHPGYDPGSIAKDQNDIAVVSFKGGLPKGYRKATLLDAKAPLPKGASTLLVGYGVNKMSGGKGTGEGILRKVAVTVADGKFGKTEVLIDQRSGKGACHGDSGGPAFVKKNGALLLWGVTNRADPINAPDDCAHFSVYTRITNQASFINSAARTLRQPSLLAKR